MSATILDPPKQRWYCPSCGRVKEVAKSQRPTSEFHSCEKFDGMSMPFVKAEYTDAAHELVIREDYIDGERGLTTHNGRPISGVYVKYGDGRNDCVVKPGKASGIGRGRNVGLG